MEVVFLEMNYNTFFYALRLRRETEGECGHTMKLQYLH